MTQINRFRYEPVSWMNWKFCLIFFENLSYPIFRDIKLEFHRKNSHQWTGFDMNRFRKTGFIITILFNFFKKFAYCLCWGSEIKTGYGNCCKWTGFEVNQFHVWIKHFCLIFFENLSNPIFLGTKLEFHCRNSHQ